MSGKTLRVAVAGDFCARDMLDTIDTAYARKALRLMQPILDDADLRMINVENAVIEGGAPISKSGPPLKALPRNLEFLTEGRFEFGILANNHVGDYHEEGVLSTIKCLAERGIGYAGAGCDITESYKPWFFETEAGRLAVLCVCENEFGIAEDGKAGTAGYNMLRMMNALRTVKADFVLVVMHSGNEHNPLPSPRVVERYHSFVDMGATAVIGMHPHCIQGYEIYRDAPIVYSTGNFLFHNTHAESECDPWYYGYLPKLTFQRGAPAAIEVIPYRYDRACTLITPFDDADRRAMLDYIERISAPIADPMLLSRYFKGWCMIGGVPYSKSLRYDPAYLEEPAFPAGHPVLSIRNLFTCEAHNELLTTLFKLMVDGEVLLAREMEQELRKLRPMPV